MSGVSERANGWTSDPVLSSEFLIDLAHCVLVSLTSWIIGTFAGQMPLLVADEADGEREFSWRDFGLASGRSVFRGAAFEADAGTRILIDRCLRTIHHRVTGLSTLKTTSGGCWEEG